MRQKSRLAGMAAACVVVAAVMSAGLSLAGGPTVKISNNNEVGDYLSDAAGKTLYVSALDTPYVNGSACGDDCAKVWPPFFMGKVEPGEGLAQRLFSSFKRADGKMQTMFRGYPLYYYANDKAPLDITGDAKDRSWFLARVPFYNIGILITKKGETLIGPDGKTLYFYKKDPKGSSVCDVNCAKVWPPLLQKEIVSPSILVGSDFGTIYRANGKRQTTYKGRPLYTNKNDNAPGQMNGQGKDGDWSIADPSKM